MTYKINCPVCGNEIDNTHYSSEWGTEEESYGCKNCGYAYEFEYGNYREYINGKEFAYSHLTKEEDLADMHKEYEKMLKKYKT